MRTFDRSTLMLRTTKTGATLAKSGSAGLVVAGSRIMVSDYDLMSVWRRCGAGGEKLFIAPKGGAKRGPLTPQQAQAFMLDANRQLRSRLQHGCQDDFHSPLNRGVLAADNELTFDAWALPAKVGCQRSPGTHTAGRLPASMRFDRVAAGQRTAVIRV